jgi:hypothetical protein
MSKVKSSFAVAFCVSLVVLISGCVNVVDDGVGYGADTRVDQDSFPYHPLVYHLDLSILAYQLYGQTLVWPFDPYYEESDTGNGNRDRLMQKVKAWIGRKGAQQRLQANAPENYRGPGVLNGFADNPHHDPILFAYDRIQPWNDTLTNAAGTWTEYQTPEEITARIGDVYMCYRTAGAPEGSVSFIEIPRKGNAGSPTAGDMLFAFEGGTGDKGEANRPPSHSLMGFVLVREKSQGRFDIHVSFRGSRSGSAGRAALEAFTDSSASGNPDWITDLGYNRLSNGNDRALVSTVGAVHRGFARSMRSIAPNLFHCLARIGDLKKNVSPDNIYVTGHSLGGALAQNFVGAVLLGNRYGPGGAGPKMPAQLSAWPWKKIKLITYGAPRTGDAVWAKALTESGLQSEYFSHPLNPVDTNALKVTDARILPRLADPDRPAGFRVLNSRDPITTEKVAGGKHVGKTVYVNTPKLGDMVSGPDVSAHEQEEGIRVYLVKSLADPRIPRTAMRYRTMKEINPARDEKRRSSVAELRKMASSVARYYDAKGVWFDRAAYDQAVSERFALEQDW